MRAEIITIGDEILIGQIVDTNSAFLGDRLGSIGLPVAQITSISDQEKEIAKNIAEALQRAEVVIVTGGLGPTKDDITKHTLAQLFGMPLIRDESTALFVEEMLARRGIPFNVLNQSQAMVPEGCTVLPNRNGTAPGMWFERDGHVLVSLPGVPFEMKALIESEVIPRLTAHFALKSVLHRTAVTFGLAESVLAETISTWEGALPSYLHLAYLPNALGIRLRLSAYEVEPQAAQQEIDAQFQRLEQIIPQYLYGYEGASLESAVGALLHQRGETVSCAESCTGGNIAHRFTLQSGASEYFLGGVVSYANHVKVSLLGVSPETLSTQGAVCSEVAEQMAEGVRQATGSTYGIATTGIAGPSGGSSEKPVGTVWFGIATPHGVFSKQMVFGTVRNENIERASSNAINLLRLHLLGLTDTLLSSGIL